MHLKGPFLYFQKMLIVYYAMNLLFLEMLGFEIK